MKVKSGNGGKNGKSKNGNRRRRGGRRRLRISGMPSGGRKVVRSALKAFDAFHPSHLPLPGPTGKYLVVRTRKTFTSSKPLWIIGPTEIQDIDSVSGVSRGHNWSNVIAVCMDSTDVLGTGNVALRGMQVPSGSPEFECVPAACSVQVIGNSSLVNATGVTYLGKLKSTLSKPEPTDTRTADDLADALLNFANPKAVSNAKLAMTTQQINLTPSNLTELHDFRAMTEDPDNTVGVWGAASSPGRDFAGFNPCFIYNPSLASLTITVCVEWRVRLSPFDPMHGSTLHYPATHPSVWDKALQVLNSSTTHGVEEVGAGGAAGYLGASAVGATEGGLSGMFGDALGTIGSALAGALPEIEAAAPLLLL